MSANRCICFNKRYDNINVSVTCNIFIFKYNTYIQKFNGCTVKNQLTHFYEVNDNNNRVFSNFYNV